MNEIEITDPSGTRARVAPERGGMITDFTTRGRAMLYMDRETLRDTSKNVRGGVPLLFPSPGKLEGDAWAQGGEKGALKQHGFARNLPWAVAGQTSSTLTLRLTSSDATRAAYPWDFAVEITYRVGSDVLSLEARVENTGTRAMPFGFGTHPYFAVADRTSFAIASQAVRAFDNVTKREVAFDATALRLGDAEIDLHLLDHHAPSASFSVDELRVTLEAPEHVRWVLWSLPGRPFVCVEPWTSPGNALNTGEALVHLPPGETRTFTQTFRVG